MDSLFRCPICRGALRRESRRYVCADGHSFDIAREGYVNLLPANHQHSKNPGDDREMAAARTRFLDGGWYAPLRDTLCRLVAEQTGEGPRLLDAGCGEGWYTCELARAAAAKGGRTIGVDLSKPAVRKAARRCPGTELAVASVYRLPLRDHSVDAVVACFSPLATEEFRRVLRPGGRFFYVVPGPRHLWELKKVLYERPYENEEKEEAYPGFQYVDVVPVETRFALTQRQAIQDLFQMTPYYWKTPKDGADRLAALETLELTASFKIHVFRRG